MLPAVADRVKAQDGIEKLKDPANSRVRRVIAVMSGKGGVGKSSVASLLAVGLARSGRRVGLLDADVTGPSIPKLFGLKSDPTGVDGQMLPQTTALGIRVMSLNLLLEKEDLPVIWRGPLISGAVKQFWTDVVWGDVDYMVIDLPPGTGDVSLTVLQSLPVDGILIVTTPQDLSQLIVKKSVNMARMLDVPILGMAQNMAYMKCPHCGEKIEPFGVKTGEDTAKAMDLELLATLPIDSSISTLGDAGKIADCECEICGVLASIIETRFPLVSNSR